MEVLGCRRVNHDGKAHGRQHNLNHGLCSESLVSCTAILHLPEWSHHISPKRLLSVELCLEDNHLSVDKAFQAQTTQMEFGLPSTSLTKMIVTIQ